MALKVNDEYLAKAVVLVDKLRVQRQLDMDSAVAQVAAILGIPWQRLHDAYTEAKRLEHKESLN
jgi:hypothetical protein